MSVGGSAIRGSRVGAGPAGGQVRGKLSPRFSRTFYCFNGHQHTLQFSAFVKNEDIPSLVDCPNCGLLAGDDPVNPPQIAKHEPFKTHLAYVKERRSEVEGEELLEERLSEIRGRRERLSRQIAQAD